MNRPFNGLAQWLTLEHSSYSAVEVVSFGWKMLMILSADSTG